MPGRDGDTVTHVAMERCEGCGQSTIICETCMDRPPEGGAPRCCWTCTHTHDLATLARYGLLER